MLPAAVHADLDSPLRTYWYKRLGQHLGDSYAGVPMAKFPEDLRVYEHLLWLSPPSVVIELGCRHGGSTLWFRDRLRTLAAYGFISRPLVVGIDVEVDLARASIGPVDPSFAGIELLAGDVRDPDLPARLERRLPANATCFVVEDTAHLYDTTLASLRGFSHFVPPGGFFVVEDGCLNVDRLRPPGNEQWGVLPALHDWLGSAQGADFGVRRDLELYGISSNPSGILQRHGHTIGWPDPAFGRRGRNKEASMALPYDGDWEIDANSYHGTLTLHADAMGNLTASTVYNDAIEGFWDDAAQRLSFIRRIGDGTDPSTYQVFTGYAWADGPTTVWMAGTFQAFRGTSATPARNVYGWKASATIA